MRFALACCALLGGCGTGAAPAPAGGGEWTAETRLFSAKCTACHQKPEPGSRSTEQWSELLDQHGDFLLLRPEDREVLLLLSR